MQKFETLSEAFHQHKPTYKVIIVSHIGEYIFKNIDPSKPQDELVESLSPLKIVVSTLNICGCVYFSEENIPALVRFILGIHDFSKTVRIVH